MLVPASANDVADNILGALMKELLRGTQQEEPASQPSAPDMSVERRVPFGEKEVQLSYAKLVKETAPAVVNVYASQQVAARSTSPFAGDPFFEEFFGRQQQMPPRVQASLGSGVLVDADGLVVTNFHVIRNADEIKVATADGREFESKVLLKDETLDLAVLKIEDKGPFPVVPIGDSEALEVGDLVLAIGNPFGVGQTTTSGIVSALARSHIGISDFGFFIQTDAAINPGNSGGALINMAGQLIGINTAIYSRSGGSIGIGFAIPSNIVRVVVEAARSGSDHFERPFIGATFEPVTAQIAEALGLPRPSGALVAAVVDDGPAARAGLRPGDVVLALNKAQIEHVDALGYRLATLSIGKPVDLTVLSKGTEKSVNVVLEKTPPDLTPASVVIDGRSPFAGAKVTDLSATLSQRLGVPVDSKGAAITEIVRRSPAAQVGLRPGDIIREINGEQMASAQDVVQAAGQNSRRWSFTIQRDGQILRQTLRF
ncbi:MAG: DegQ family serine endoprotease [Rhizobiaceae bacterium]|nr:DegQ family serine endoprotease [Rhizobiaceae bacterium]